MANEILIGNLATGLTVTIQLYSGTSTSGAPISATELGATGVYIASMPAGKAYGYYSLVALSAGSTVASGLIYWDSKYEIPVGIATFLGLDPNNPATITPTAQTAGAIVIALTGDGVSQTIITRTS